MTVRTRVGWERWLALAAIAYLVLHFLNLSQGTDPGGSIAATQTAFTHTAREQTVGGLLLEVGALLILLFAVSLRAHLRQAEDEPHSLTAVVLGSAVASTALAFVGGAMVFVLESKVAKLGDANLTYALFQVWWAALLGSLALQGIMTLAASTAALLTGMMPRWISGLGILCGLALAVGCLAFYPMGAVVEGPADGIAYIGEILFAIWSVASAVVILRGRHAPVIAPAADQRAETALAR